MSALDFAGKRVTVLGLGIEGIDAARYLVRQRAIVTIADAKREEQLRERIAELEGLPVNLSLGEAHANDIGEAEALFVSQGVPLELPAVQKAQMRGIPLISMMGLFLEVCPGPVVGITGSSGKTTTTALVGQMFEADERPFFVGGNIGVGLLDHLSSIRSYTWSVLEVSHTQLQLAQHSPHVAAVLNITPNHLDRFSWDDYRELKAKLLRFQTPEDICVLGFDDPEARALGLHAASRVAWFTMGAQLEEDGVFLRDGWAVSRCRRFEARLFPMASLRLQGAHNQANALAAAATAWASGVSAEAISCAVESFRGVPHRLELVGEIGGAKYYNDSIATTPERTLAGLRSFQQPIVLLLGGRDKQLPMDELAREAAARCRAVFVFGESAGKLEAAMRPAAGQVQVRGFETLEEAFSAASETARSGDVVLLSPACTSYDAYENFEQRGNHFRSLVLNLAQAAGLPAPEAIAAGSGHARSSRKPGAQR